MGRPSLQASSSKAGIQLQEKPRILFSLPLTLSCSLLLLSLSCYHTDTKYHHLWLAWSEERIPQSAQEPLHPLCLEALKLAGGLSHVPWEKSSNPLLHPQNPYNANTSGPKTLIHKFRIGIDLKNHLLQTLHFTQAEAEPQGKRNLPNSSW